MKKAAVIAPLLALLFALSCAKDDGYETYSYNERTLYSSSGKAEFSAVILFLKPYILDGGQKKYLVVDSLRNISVTINGRSLRPLGSYALDTAHVSGKEIVSGYCVATEPVVYPVQVELALYPDSFQTAGQYADLLNSYFTITPGAYIFRIHSFDVLSVAGQQNSIYTPTLSLPLEVGENCSSANMGEFEVQMF
ncbi:MAG: hypothetical protein LBK18_08590 [Prevotellaceae bacterium]|jgi:hypothetical protein|nr:hypothetical protein [Prevotellaceae bacterium]